MAQGCVIEFYFPELSSKKQRHWLVVKGTEVDYCLLDPGQDTDLLITGSVKSLTSIHMGYSSIDDEISQGDLSVNGSPQLAKRMSQWLCLSPFAAEPQKAPQLTYAPSK